MALPSHYGSWPSGSHDGGNGGAGAGRTLPQSLRCVVVGSTVAPHRCLPLPAPLPLLLPSLPPPQPAGMGPKPTG